MKFLFILLFMCVPCFASDIAVIVNIKNYSRISKKDISRIFKGELLTYRTIDLPVKVAVLGDPLVFNRFNTQVLELEASQLLSIWSKILYIDSHRSPYVADRPSELVDYVTSYEGAIGYLPLDQVTNDVRIVYVVRAG